MDFTIREELLPAPSVHLRGMSRVQSGTHQLPAFSSTGYSYGAKVEEVKG